MWQAAHSALGREPRGFVEPLFAAHRQRISMGKGGADLLTAEYVGKAVRPLAGLQHADDQYYKGHHK